MKRSSLLIAPLALVWIFAYSTTAHGQNTISDTGEFRIDDGQSFSFTLMGTTIVVNPPLDPVDPDAPARAAEETLATATVVLLGVGATCSGIFEIPAQVEMNTTTSARNVTDITDIQRTLGNIVCILTQPEGANPLDCI